MMLRRTVLVLLASAVSLAPAASALSPAGDAFFDSRGRAIRLPLLVIVGSADPIKAGIDTFKLVPRDLRVVVIDGATHGGIRGAAGRQEFPAAGRDLIAAHRSASDR